MRASEASAQQLRPVFMIVLRGSAILAYTPPATEAAAPSEDGAKANGVAANGMAANGVPSARVPIHRLRTNDHVGGINVLLGRVDLDGHVKHLELRAGDEGCTLLTWTW